jgi:hypothetical protein
MKLSWTKFKISIAGARLIHLVQKDNIWDHGTMAEQARTTFMMIQKATCQPGIEALKKQCMKGCFDRVKARLDAKDVFIEQPIVNEIAVIEVNPGKGERPDMFTVLINGQSKFNTSMVAPFSVEMCFAREGRWWMLSAIRRWTGPRKMRTSFIK